MSTCTRPLTCPRLFGVQNVSGGRGQGVCARTVARAHCMRFTSGPGAEPTARVFCGAYVVSYLAVGCSRPGGPFGLPGAPQRRLRNLYLEPSVTMLV